MSYKIAGMAIKNEYLALGTILSTIAIASASMGGDKKEGAAPAASQPIPSSSKDEEDFVKQFLEENEGKDKH